MYELYDDIDTYSSVNKETGPMPIMSFEWVKPFQLWKYAMQYTLVKAEEVEDIHSFGGIRVSEEKKLLIRL